MTISRTTFDGCYCRRWTCVGLTAAVGYHCCTGLYAIFVVLALKHPRVKNSPSKSTSFKVPASKCYPSSKCCGIKILGTEKCVSENKISRINLFMKMLLNKA